jgi:putative autotransporter adhesin-like protein
MTKRLAWIAVVSLGVSAACGSLAALITATAWVGGGDRPWAATTRTCAAVFSATNAGSRRSTGRNDDVSTGDSQPRTVALEWQGGDAVQINIPARVHYRPGPTAQASVSGDAELISHVRMRGGTLEWDTIVNCFSAGDLVVRLTGPAVPAWTLNGSGALDLSDIKQDELRIRMHGSGTVTASGEAHAASLDVAGSSSADLSRLITQQASASIRGSAEVDIAPREDVDISISGSAVVRLHGAVARIHSHVSGSGQIKQVP